MIKKENCIQLKIDQLIENINSKIYNISNSQEQINDIITLISFNHCLDLFEFLKNYYKIQKNELIVQMAIIYDMLGYNKKALEYIKESLNIVENVPTVILFKSVLYASLNKLEEAQKYLLKYKYLIGEDSYYNFIYNSIRIVYYYFSEYEENIILGEINLIEEKYPKYFSNNIILFIIKSKLLKKLSEKIKKIDKNRSNLYHKESKENREKAFNNGEMHAHYLNEKDIVKEDATKLLLIVYPDLLEYKPKALVDYNFNFHNGFGIFFTLFKISKILKLKMQIKIFKKKNKNFNFKKYLINGNTNNINNNNNLLNIKELSQNDIINIINSKKMKKNENVESILTISKSVWLENFINNNNETLSNKITENKYLKNDDINYIKTINNKIKINYYVYEGYYSKMNLNENILKNINYNDEYKKKIQEKDSLLEEMNNEFIDNIKENKSNDDILLEESYVEENETINFRKKNIKNINNIERNGYKIKLIQSIKNKTDESLNKSNSKDNGKTKNIKIEKESLKNPNNNLYNYMEKNKEEKGKQDSQFFVDKKNYNKIKKINVNNLLDNINKLELNNIESSRTNAKLYLNNNIKISKNKNKTPSENIKDKDSAKKKRRRNIKYKNNNNNNEKNINDNNNKKNNKLNNINKINNDIHKEKNINKIKQKNDIINDKEKIFMKYLEKDEHYYKNLKARKINKKNSQTEKLINQIYVNLDNTTFTRFNTLNQKLKKNNRLKDLTKPSKKYFNKKHLELEINSFNIISANKFRKDDDNYITNTLTENITDNKEYLKFKLLKKNPKSENKKRNELLIKKKINFLTVNIDLLSKKKICTPKYQKTSLLNSFKFESRDLKRDNSNKTPLNKLDSNYYTYKLGLKQKIKNNKLDINYKKKKPSFNKYMNNKITKSIYYFNNILGSKQLNKNESFYKMEKTFTFK